MKTDKERFLELMSDFGVQAKTYDEYYKPTCVKDDGMRNTYIIETGIEPKQRGYIGFVTEFEFDADGKFVKMGIWE